MDLRSKTHLKHICDRCGRLHQTCDCSEYAVNPINFAGQLRMAAHIAAHLSSQVEDKTPADFIRRKAKLAAQRNEFQLMFWLHDKNWTHDEAEAAAVELRAEGLKVLVGRETTKWHSHDTWESEEYILVNWE